MKLGTLTIAVKLVLQELDINNRVKGSNHHHTKPEPKNYLYYVLEW